MRTPLQSYNLVRKELSRMIEEGTLDAVGFTEAAPHCIKCLVQSGKHKGIFTFPVMNGDDATEKAALRDAVGKVLQKIEALKGV